jgi:hypothetical protein
MKKTILSRRSKCFTLYVGLTLVLPVVFVLSGIAADGPSFEFNNPVWYWPCVLATVLVGFNVIFGAAIYAYYRRKHSPRAILALNISAAILLLIFPNIVLPLLVWAWAIPGKLQEQVAKTAVAFDKDGRTQDV